MRPFPLGAFPAMGLAEARDEARTLRVRVRQGEDPVAERRRLCAMGRDAKEGIGTLAAFLDLYGRSSRAALKSWGNARRRIGTVFAPHLDRPLAPWAPPSCRRRRTPTRRASPRRRRSATSTPC